MKISTLTIVAFALVIGTAIPSNAASNRVAKGKNGTSLSVSKSILLNPNGEDIAVSGKVLAPKQEYMLHCVSKLKQE